MFTATQLEFIKSCAQKRKNQGELSVYDRARDASIDGDFWEGFDTRQLNVIKYCAEECKRQRSGEMSVYDMVNAWNWAWEVNAQRGMPDEYQHPNISNAFIEHLGKMIEPIDNKNGFRTIPIGITDGFNWIEKARWERIPELLTILLDGYYSPNSEPPIFSNPLSKTAEDQFYYEYENIHPFRDGNGRSGKILYNYLCGTLDNPIMPPNFWNVSNP